nr:uncharacterized protein LOC109147908 [Ipomoea batatas]
MDFSNSRSSSSSPRMPNRNFTLQYEPCLYCKCGLKSPLCTARESGRKFFGCQNWKGNGCGFFLYVEDIMQGLGAIEYESTKVDVMDCKKIFESVRDEVMVIQQRLGRIEEATKNMNRSGHLNYVNVVKVVGAGVVVLLAVIVWFNVRFITKAGLSCIALTP